MLHFDVTYVCVRRTGCALVRLHDLPTRFPNACACALHLPVTAAAAIAAAAALHRVIYQRMNPNSLWR